MLGMNNRKVLITVDALHANPSIKELWERRNMITVMLHDQTLPAGMRRELQEEGIELERRLWAVTQ